MTQRPYMTPFKNKKKELDLFPPTYLLHIRKPMHSQSGTKKLTFFGHIRVVGRDIIADRKTMNYYDLVKL